MIREHPWEQGLEPVVGEHADLETASEGYARRFAGPVGAWFLQVQAQATLRMLAPYREGAVLDVGGGHGQLVPILVRAGHPVTVLGSAAACGERIRSFIARERCSFRVGNLLSLPFPDQSFDVVISYRLLPHVGRWRRLLAELARVARRAVLIDYPAVRSVNYLAPYLFSWKKRIEGNTRTFTCFRESQLMEVLEPLGFRLAERYSEFMLPMALHRLLQRPRLSAAIESCLRACGLTDRWGSPVILKAVRRDGA